MVRWSCRKGRERPRCQTVARERDKCPVGVSAGGHGGMMGGALPSTVARARQSLPPPVGVGGSGWPCPEYLLHILFDFPPVKVHLLGESVSCEDYCCIRHSMERVGSEERVMMFNNQSVVPVLMKLQDNSLLQNL